LAIVAAYLIGAVPIGFLIARAFGVADIRRHGSGNIGTTNVLRTLGKGPAILTLIGDVAKGWCAVLVAAAISGGDASSTAAGAVAAVTGNCWSVFLGFRGGKGVATGLGALLRLVPWATAPAALVWVALVLGFRYVSLASLAAAACIPLGVLIFTTVAPRFGYGWPDVLASLAIAIVVTVRHGDNIARLRSGTERRLGERSATA
jgi:glycerol-3-phosphate acyltransferase PlsY